MLTSISPTSATDALTLIIALTAISIASIIVASHYWLRHRALASRVATMSDDGEPQRARGRLIPSAFDDTPLGCMVWEPGFRVLEWNTRAEEIFGWPREDILQRNFLPLLLPVHSRDKFMQDIALLFTDGHLNQGALPHVTRAGTTVTCEWHHSALYDDKGGPVRIISLCVPLPGVTDLTIEHSLFRSLVELSDEPAVMIFEYPTGRIRYASASVCRHFGESLVSLQRKRLSDWEPRFGGDAAIDDLFNRGNSVTFESEHRHLNGHVLPVEVTLNRIESCGQVFVGVYIRNIARRHADEAHRRRSEIEQALREPEQRYREIFLHTSDAIFTLRIDHEDGLVFDGLNPAAVEALGMPADVLTGIALGDIVAGRFGMDRGRALTRNLDYYLTAVDTGMPAEYEDSLSLFADGDANDRRHQVKILPLAGDNGIERLICIGHDVTLRTKYELELRTKAKLEQRMSHYFANAPGHFFSFSCHDRRHWTLSFASPGLHSAYNLPVDAGGNEITQMVARIHPADRRQVVAALLRCRRRARPCQTEFRITRSTAESTWIELRAAGHLASDGSTTIHGFMHDISVRKQVDQCLADSRRILHELATKRELAVEAERKRIADDLNDEFGQILSALRFRISALSIEYAALLPEIGNRTQELHQLVDQALHDVRSVSASLRPPLLDAGLAAAIEWLVRDYSRRYPIDFSLHAQDDWPTLSDSITTTIFRFIQEAMTNAVRHADAHHIEVVFTREESACCIEVRDDGCGFTLPALDSDACGLSAMYQRATMLGGKCRIITASGEGTVVRLDFTANAVGDAPDLPTPSRA